VLRAVEDPDLEIFYEQQLDPEGTKGIATAALRKFLLVVQERPLYAWVAQSNAASICVLEKAGFMLDRKRRVTSYTRSPKAVI
jgi:RimJ/RimL family protein N-acetyltransferase